VGIFVEKCIVKGAIVVEWLATLDKRTHINN